MCTKVRGRRMEMAWMPKSMQVQRFKQGKRRADDCEWTKRRRYRDWLGGDPSERTPKVAER